MNEQETLEQYLERTKPIHLTYQELKTEYLDRAVERDLMLADLESLSQEDLKQLGKLNEEIANIKLRILAHVRKGTADGVGQEFVAACRKSMDLYCRWNELKDQADDARDAFDQANKDEVSAKNALFDQILKERKVI